MLYSKDNFVALLSPEDPLPVEMVNTTGASPFVLSCEHAGRAVPGRLGDLGVSPDDMNCHIAWDVGAEAVARHLSERLDAPLALQRYSRLVVDCNRPYDAPDCIPAVSDGVSIPANEGLTEFERRQRFMEIHEPFHRALTQLLDGRSGKSSYLVAVHSFTPRLTDGQPRPWHLGVLFNRDNRLAERLLEAFRLRNPDWVTAANQPYIVDDVADYTIPVHGEGRGLPHVLLEIRNDLISDSTGQKHWADLIAESLVAAVSEKGFLDGQ